VQEGRKVKTFLEFARPLTTSSAYVFLCGHRVRAHPASSAAIKPPFPTSFLQARGRLPYVWWRGGGIVSEPPSLITLQEPVSYPCIRYPPTPVPALIRCPIFGLIQSPACHNPPETPHATWLPASPRQPNEVK